MDIKGTQMYLFLLRGMEAVSKCQAMNTRVGRVGTEMIGRLLSLRICLYRLEKDKQVFLLSGRL